MKKRKILAVLLTITMLFALSPVSVFAAPKQPAGEEFLEELEMAYAEYIDDRNKYCGAVWNEIQQVYKEASASTILSETITGIFASSAAIRDSVHPDSTIGSRII